MAQAINGVPSLNLKTTPATKSGQVTGTAATDPNSFQLLVNWFMNQNISNLASIGSPSTDNGGSDTSSSNNSFFGGGDAFSGLTGGSSASDPFSVMGQGLMQQNYPNSSIYGSLAPADSLMLNNPLLDLQRLKSFNDYSNLVNSTSPTAASYTDPKTNKAAVGIIEEVNVDKNGAVTFTISGEHIPLSAVKNVTRYEDGVTV